MNEDEQTLFQLVQSMLNRPKEADSALIASLRTVVGYRKGLFPAEFIKALYEPDRSNNYPSARAEALEAILAADSLVPESLKTASELGIEGDLDPRFELEDEDRKAIMSICSDLRGRIFNTASFDAPHRRRLLDRVAAIEREVLLPKGHLDVLLAGMNDVGEALGKFGKDVKPIFDRMSELVGIARKASKEYEQIPPPDEVRRLPPPNDE